MAKKISNVNLLSLKKGSCDEVLASARNGGELSLMDYSPELYDDKVVLNGDIFKDLFDVPRYKARKSLKLLAIIKITNENGESIHRAFFGKKGIDNLNRNQAGLSHNSIRLLNGDGENPDWIDNVTLSRGSLFLYFWDHPFHATRISMRVGLIGIILSLISILISILFSCA